MELQDLNTVPSSAAVSDQRGSAQRPADVVDLARSSRLARTELATHNCLNESHVPARIEQHQRRDRQCNETAAEKDQNVADLAREAGMELQSRAEHPRVDSPRDGKPG